MLQPVSELDKPRGVLVPKPQTSIYTVLLGIAVGALSIGCLLLLLELWLYGNPFTGPWNVPVNLR